MQKDKQELLATKCLFNQQYKSSELKIFELNSKVGGGGTH